VDIEVTYTPSWHLHDGFVTANTTHVQSAIDRLPPELRPGARVVFTAHSIPTRMAERSCYREHLTESARAVAARAGVTDWTVVYQSRSGRPDDAWLEPDVCDHLRQAKRERLEAVVLCPIGFVCDHIEVLYDLDREAAAVAQEIGLAVTRAEAVNDDPQFLDMMADIVLAMVRQYGTGRPLPLRHAVTTVLESA
jgi:protoporphyrin/coproporphyrin ferrochelatase